MDSTMSFYLECLIDICGKSGANQEVLSSFLRKSLKILIFSNAWHNLRMIPIKIIMYRQHYWLKCDHKNSIWKKKLRSSRHFNKCHRASASSIPCNQNGACIQSQNIQRDLIFQKTWRKNLHRSCNDFHNMNKKGRKIKKNKQLFIVGSVRLSERVVFVLFKNFILASDLIALKTI